MEVLKEKTATGKPRCQCITSKGDQCTQVRSSTGSKYCARFHSPKDGKARCDSSGRSITSKATKAKATSTMSIPKFKAKKQETSRQAWMKDMLRKTYTVSKPVTKKQRTL